MAHQTILGALIALNLNLSAYAETISHDRGGEIITYSIKAKKMQSVRFDGPCASACTLFLAIEDKCVTPRARFGFHRAYGASARANEVATQHLLRNYPGWVKRWIAAKGGLTSRLIWMPYSYAAKFVKGC